MGRCHREPGPGAWPIPARGDWNPGVAADVEQALASVTSLVFQGTNGNGTSARAHIVLPSAAYVEYDGTFTNFQGRVQRFRAALAPLGEALPGWEILVRVGQALNAQDAVFTVARAEQVFNALVQARPPFAGMTYRALGDSGRVVQS